MSSITFTICDVSCMKNIKENEDIRICVTTYPGRAKVAKLVKGKNLSNINLTWQLGNGKFMIDIILVSFRRKSFINNDPIIGTFKINVKQIPARKDFFSTYALKPFNDETPMIERSITYPEVGVRLFVEVPNTAMATKEAPVEVQNVPSYVNTTPRTRGSSLMI